MKTKLCKKCGVEKPLSEMVRSKRDYIDGYAPECKECHNLYHYAARDSCKYSIQKTCKECQKTFKARTIRAEYCSRRCGCKNRSRAASMRLANLSYTRKHAVYTHRYKMYEKSKHTHKCDGCGKMYSGSQEFHHYCSVKCRRRYGAVMQKDSKYHSETLSDQYIKSILRSHDGLTNPPSELIELKRIEIKGKRLLKQLQ